MIYDCLFESVWFTFREQVAPAPSINLDKIKTFRLSASCHSYYEWQAAGSRRRWPTSDKAGAMTIRPMYDKWLSFRNDYDSLFGSRAVSIGRQSDRNGSEAQPESRDEQGKIQPRQRRISKKLRSVHTFDSGCIMPCGTIILRAI